MIESSERAGPRSALDLWHATAAPTRRLGLGRTGPGPDGMDAREAVDVAVIAPDMEEVSRAWLEQAISRAAARLAPDAVLWVFVPRRWRRTAERILAASDLALVDAVLTVPPWPHSAHLIPVAGIPLRYAVARHLGTSAAFAGLLAALARVDPARAVLRRAAPGCGLLAARSARASPLRWLGEIDGAEPATATATIGPRRDARVAVVMRFTRGSRRPDLAVKVALDEGGAERLAREREALETLAPEARRAGAHVPRVRPGTVPWLLATGALPGHPAAGVLSGQPERLEPIAESVAAWLETWSVATVSNTIGTRELLDHAVVARAGRVAGNGGEEMADYLEALRVLTARLEGRPIVRTAAHNDLTMSNVLVDGDRLGVVDWEAATSSTLPLLDLWYGLADSLARAQRLDLSVAVEALVRGRPPAPPALARLPARHARALGLSGDQAALSFHACWMHHAANELERGEAERPFLGVVRRVAAVRLMWPERDRALPP